MFDISGITGIKKMKETSVKELGQELNSDLVVEVKRIKARIESGELNDRQVQGQLQYIKELNKQRIQALGMFSIQGGKDV